MINFRSIIDFIFPFHAQMSILQLEEYKIGRYLRWNIKNIFKRKVSLKRGLTLTQKIKYLTMIYAALCVVSFLVSRFLFFIFIFEPFLGLTLAILILKPYEIYNKKLTIKRTRNKILSLKNLRVIGITGSFGKSSTKEILYQMLRKKFRVLRTPESFNTTFGIAKVVDLELNGRYDFFVCEMAAYKIGEIKELCHMVPPDFGILTGITTQHFERFGSLENTIKAKFELVEAVSKKENMIFNLGDQNILGEVERRGIKNPNGCLEAEDVSFGKYGSRFDVLIEGKKYRVTTPLFGYANVKNILAASSMALKLGLSKLEVIKAIEDLKPFDNRMVLNRFDKAILVNNTYSSNPQGFRETIETARRIKGKKVLITPGLVELGTIESEVHLDLGRLAGEVFDMVFLVGKNNRTVNFSKGLKNFKFIRDERQDYFGTIEQVKGKFDWIFLENDVTENY